MHNNATLSGPLPSSFSTILTGLEELFIHNTQVTVSTELAVQIQQQAGLVFTSATHTGGSSIALAAVGVAAPLRRLTVDPLPASFSSHWSAARFRAIGHSCGRPKSNPRSRSNPLGGRASAECRPPAALQFFEISPDIFAFPPPFGGGRNRGDCV